MKPYEILEHLSKAIQIEMETDSLQRLDEDIYEVALKSIERKDELTDHFVRLVADYLVLLFTLRLLKVVNGADPKLATQKERLVFQKYSEFRKALKAFLTALRSPTQTPKKSNRMLVVFNTHIETFIDSELHPLGPFEKNDMAYIPEEDALILSKYGIVEVLLGE